VVHTGREVGGRLRDVGLTVDLEDHYEEGRVLCGFLQCSPAHVQHPTLYVYLGYEREDNS
jgi:hypothetical protein